MAKITESKSTLLRGYVEDNGSTVTMDYMIEYPKRRSAYWTIRHTKHFSRFITNRREKEGIMSFLTDTRTARHGRAVEVMTPAQARKRITEFKKGARVPPLPKGARLLPNGIMQYSVDPQTLRDARKAELSARGVKAIAGSGIRVYTKPAFERRFQKKVASM